MKGSSGSMTRRATLVVAIALFLVSPFAYAEPRPETAAVPETQGGPAPAKPSPKPARAKPVHAKPVRAKPARANSAPAPVVFEGKTLFFVKEAVLSATPEERARGTSERLAKLVKDRSFDADSIEVVEDEFASILVAEGTVLTRVYDRDAVAEGMSRQDLAAQWVEAIRTAIEEHNQAYTFRSLLFAAIYAVVATGVLLLLLLLYRHQFPRLYARIRNWSGSRIRPVKIGSLELFHAAQIVRLLLALARGFRILTTVVFAYVWLLYVLSLFPWTRGITAAVIGYILDPLKAFGAAVLASLPDLFVLAVIAFITRYVVKFARFFFDAVEKGIFSNALTWHAEVPRAAAPRALLPIRTAVSTPAFVHEPVRPRPQSPFEEATARSISPSCRDRWAGREASSRQPAEPEGRRVRPRFRPHRGSRARRLSPRTSVSCVPPNL